MSQKRLVSLLKIFDKESLSELEYHLRYKKNQKLIAVFHLFKRRIGQSELRQKDPIFIEFLQKQEISKGYANLLIATLVQRIENFLIGQSLGDFSNYRALLLRKIIRTEALDDIFLKDFETAKRNATKQPVHSDNLIDDYWLERDYLDFLTINQPQKLSFSNNLECIEVLDKYYLIQRIKLMMEVVLFSIRAPEIQLNDIPSLETIKALIKSNTFQEDTLFRVYKLAFELLTHETDDYQQLSVLIKKEGQHLTKKDLYCVYIVLINFHITKKGESASNLRRVFDLYKEMIAFDFFEIENYVVPGRFKNVVTIACKFQEFDWAFEFIKNYTPALAPNTRDSVVHFNHGAIYFYQGNLEAAQTHLLQVQNVNVFYDLDSKSLLSKIYFEREDYYALIRFLTPFKDFVRKHPKLSKVKKAQYLNYIKLLGQVTKVMQLPFRVQKREVLLNKLSSFNPLVYKNWLKEKINAL